MPEEVRLEEDKAKHGRSTGRIARLLAVSLILVAVAWLGLTFYGGDDDGQKPADSPNSSSQQ